MAVVETERHGQVLVVRMNRPERLNALNHEMRSRLAETWTEFRRDDSLEVAIFTGTGRGFCAGEDMKESLQNRMPGGRRPEPGGWNRFVLVVDDIQREVERLRRSGVSLRSDVIVGVGGNQVLLNDPSGNPVELFEYKK